MVGMISQRIKTMTLLIEIAILLSISSIGYSQVSFTPFRAIATGSAPTVVSIGDLNNDGRNDVVLCTGYGVDVDPKSDNKSFVFIQDASGNLSAPVVYQNSNFTPYAIAISDVNNDNLNDLIIGYDDSIGVFYQNKSGTLNPLTSYYSGQFERIDGLSTGDLNGDGLQDIAISYYSSSSISILYQNNAGGFRSTSIQSPATSANHVIEIADVNNDKRSDIVLSMIEGVSVYTQTANGTLNKYVTYGNGNTTNSSDGLAIGDVNNDGLKDIVQTISGNTSSATLLMYYQDKLSNLMQPPVSLPAYQTPEPVRIADLNCDKKNEIIIAHGGTQKLTIYEQTATSFTTYSSITIGDANHYNPYGMSIGDINNDDRNDIVLADYKNGLIILTNTSTPLGACCKKVVKPQQPVGMAAICKNGLTTKYTDRHTSTDSIIWNLYPSTASSIVFSSKDSCLITWNDSWYGKASISVMAINACGSSTSQPLFVTVHIPPLNIGNDTSLCKQSSITVNAKSGFDRYLWGNKSTDSTIIATSPSIQYVTATNVCGSVSDTIIISAFATQQIVLPSDSILCSGSSMTFDVSRSGKNSYLWQDGKTTARYTITNAGIYSVAITDSNNCQNSKTITVTALSKPSISLPDDTVACNNIALPLQVQCSSCNYIWQDGSTTANLTATKKGTYSVTATNVCGISKDSIRINIIQSPVLKVINDTVLCDGTSFILDAGIAGRHSYLWQDGKTDSLYRISQTGNYSVTVTDSFHCKNNQSFTIAGLTKPFIQFPNDTTFCDSLSLLIDVNCAGCSYLWNDASTIPQQTLTNAGMYSVTVTNICGSKTDTVIIKKVDCQSMLDVPTAFSPNDDNLNDVLFAVGKNIENVSFRIFNRWGQLVFESTDLKKGWDGTQNGKPVDDGVYMFSITATATNDGHVITQSGNITLIR